MSVRAITAFLGSFPKLLLAFFAVPANRNYPYSFLFLVTALALIALHPRARPQR